MHLTPNRFTTALAALIVASAQYSTLHAQQAPAVAGPLAFDVTSVRLGASTAEARAALVRSGHRIEGTSDVKSFYAAVRREAARRLARPARTMIVMTFGPVYVAPPFEGFTTPEKPEQCLIAWLGAVAHFEPKL